MKNTVQIFVGVVLIGEEDKIYLIKEEDKNDIGHGRWNLPGGSVDIGESLVEAAIRETMEETGYKADVTALLGCYKCRKGEGIWMYVVFGGRVYKRSGKCSDPDVKTGRWFSKKEFLHLDSSKIVHPDMQLVYNFAMEEKGLSLSSVKFIDYTIG